ncbi:MAG: Cof-type HAD-IIB family hydrolase [Tannerella sp.]|jgi:Cof subfamily protein (haloacid dehalogenase superfamily)|nr:Cof-type HAD-IIB family hydrolase [Tannerella sp.]
MKYEMIVLDVDGTLLNDDKIITARMRAALIKVQQMGIRIVLASGRPTCGVLPLAKELDMDKNEGFILSYNGGQIMNVQTGEILFEKRVDPKMFPYLERKANKNNFAIFTYHEDTIYANDISNEHIIQEAELNSMRLKELDNFSEAITFSPYKCMIVSDDEDALIGLENHWKKRLAGELDVFRSEKYFLEVVPPFIDKANTLSILLEKLGVASRNIVAIGDGVCDVTMIQLAGLGIAMGNAQESVKACADYVTLSNEEDGVAVAIENVIISEIRPAEIPLDKLNESGKRALMGNLGIQYTYASEDRVEATMPVDERTRQPFGILHGGATLALAETVAGLGSLILCKPDEIMVGMQVSGNHVSSAHEGDTVRAVGTIIHKGRSSHVWNIDIYTSTDKLVSSIRVVNSVIKKR